MLSSSFRVCYLFLRRLSCLNVMNYGLNQYSTGKTGRSTTLGSDALRKPRLLDQVRTLIQLKHMSWRTAKAYVYWIKRFIYFHDKRHPCELGAEEIAAFSAISAEFIRRFRRKLECPLLGAVSIDRCNTSNL